MHALEQEFDRIRELSSEIPCWQAMFWDKMTVDLPTWLLLDAWYRSRCLDLPKSGVAMVPCLDMANHSTDPNTHWSETSDEVVLQLGRGHQISAGDEATINYGGGKSQAEMLFSYGFTWIENPPRNSLQLAVGPFPDDPLGKAKMRVFGRPPFLVLTETDDKVNWDCPFEYLKCVNQEDGLAFKLAQQTDGELDLRMFWDDHDVTESAVCLDTIISNHSYWPLFQLRVVTDIQDQVKEQLERIKSAVNVAEAGVGNFREGLAESVLALRDTETQILELAMRDLEIEVCAPITKPLLAEYDPALQG